MPVRYVGQQGDYRQAGKLSLFSGKLVLICVSVWEGCHVAYYCGHRESEDTGKHPEPRCWRRDAKTTIGTRLSL